MKATCSKVEKLEDGTTRFVFTHPESKEADKVVWNFIAAPHDIEKYPYEEGGDFEIPIDLPGKPSPRNEKAEEVRDEEAVHVE